MYDVGGDKHKELWTRFVAAVQMWVFKKRNHIPSTSTF
jgi:hypothetical protein